MFDVSIVIVNWNTRDILRDCLRSVYEQTQNLEFEVIVVDNASSDGSVEMVKQEFPQVVLVENIKNMGFAAANNQGMQIANGRYILLLNSDTVVLNGAIQKSIVFSDQHPEGAVTGCKVLNPDMSLQPTCFMYPSILNLILSASYLYKIFPQSRFLGRERMTWWDRDDVREVEVVTGCFMLVRREAIDQVGMMDEQFFMYAEETDWCYRFKKTGWKVMFTPEAEIIHLGGQSSKQKRVESIIQLRLGILQFYHKNKSYPYFIIAGIFISSFFVLRIPRWFFKCLVRRTNGDACDRLNAYLCAWYKVLKAIIVPKRKNFKV